MHNKNTWIIFVVVTVVVAVLAFVGGDVYGQKKVLRNSGAKWSGMYGNGANFGGNFQGQGLAGDRRGAGSVGGAMMRGGMNANFVNGDIISKDDKSVTLQLRDGGSKIVFFSSSTPIMQATAGTVADLQVGQSLMVNGTVGTDGSLVAQNIQIRPASTTFVGR